MLAQFEGVAVRGGPVFEDEDELVARAIEGAMPPLSLTQTTRFLSSVKTASPAARISGRWRQSMQT